MVTETLGAQVRLEQGLPYTPAEDGYFLTDEQMVEIAQDVQRLAKVESLLALYREQEELYERRVTRMEKDLAEAEKRQDPGFWERLEEGLTWFAVGSIVGVSVAP